MTVNRKRVHVCTRFTIQGIIQVNVYFIFKAKPYQISNFTDELYKQIQCCSFLFMDFQLFFLNFRVLQDAGFAFSFFIVSPLLAPLTFVLKKV